ncbi:1-acyl-sn-glycerol-3-phosphate acyltransferase [Patescibacteria group bacterium]|nr:1-acyl-sn-glycerol-3-phosphate acyltransferase [Patescibacteria group bacterium]
MLYKFLKIFIAPIIRFVWVGKVEGLENIPKTKPAILAANHESYFDFLCLTSILKRRIYFFAAEKFF